MRCDAPGGAACPSILMSRSIEMLKSLARLVAWFTASSDQDETQTDPLSHPLIAKMTARELADLPFPKPCREGRRANCCPA